MRIELARQGETNEFMIAKQITMCGRKMKEKLEELFRNGMERDGIKVIEGLDLRKMHWESKCNELFSVL